MGRDGFSGLKNSDFDRNFKNAEKLVKRGIAAGLLAYFCYLVFVGAGLFFVGYVVFHFISKFW